MTRINNIFISLLLSLLPLLGMAQGQCETSSLIRQLVSDQERKSASAFSKSIGKGATTNANDALKGAMHAQEGMEDNRLICCFVKVEQGIDAEEKIASLGGKCHAVMGDLCIATLPISQLPKACNAKGIRRIEAKKLDTRCFMDTTRVILGMKSVNEGITPLPQPFTGKGVLMGIMDIGFDLTHPNFLSRTDKSLRIRRLWDMFDFDKNNTNKNLPIGKEFLDETALMNKMHSADGIYQTHGTHTLGSLAGTGYNSNYVGMLPDADICCVANITEDNPDLIPDSLEYLVTYALDALGFKYIFDYADEIGKPCVISFSEGGGQDLRGDDMLYYESLEKMTGKGHIIVSAAGNDGGRVNYIHKTEDRRDAVARLLKWAAKDAKMYFTIDTSAPIDLYLVGYASKSSGGVNDTIHFALDFEPGTDADVSPSGLRKNQTDTIKVRFGNESYTFTLTSFPNCYDPSRYAYDLDIESKTTIGYNFDIDMIIKERSQSADVKVYSFTGELMKSNYWDRNDAITDACICSPASAPCVICVGSTSYRTEIRNYRGIKKNNNMGTNGVKTQFSSVGPTMDGRIKPDVMAPGANIISSYSSFYEAHNPYAGDIDWDVKHFNYNGRTYAWNTNSGTSMACPVAAGIIGSWLEARPTMTPQDVMDVIAHTSRRIDTSLSYPNNLHGYGEINAYEGLLYVLGLSNVDGLSHNPAKEQMKVTRQGSNALLVTLAQPAETSLTCRLYSTSGTLLRTFCIERGTDSCLINASVPKGVYAIQVGNGGSLLVRL